MSTSLADSSTRLVDWTNRAAGFVASLMLIALLPLLAAAQSTAPAPDSIIESPGDTLTLEQVISQVLKNNNRLAAAQYMREAAERRVSAAGTWDDPMLMVGVQNVPTNFNFTMDDMTMKMVGISQNIPYSGAKGLERKAARADALASAEEFRGAQVDLVAAAKQAYFDLYFGELNLHALERQHALLEQVVSSTTAKLRSNQAGQDEVLAAQTALWRHEAGMVSVKQELIAAVYTLNSMRGAEPTARIYPLAAPAAAPLPPTADQWIAAAEKNNPALARLERQAESYGLSAASSRRMRWPMLGLSASYGFRSGTTVNDMMEVVKRDNMVSFQANFSIPIFSGRQQGNMARSMQAMQRSTTAQAEQLRREIRSDILSLYNRAILLTQNLTSYQDRIIPASEDAYRAALAGYSANRTSFASLLNYVTSIYQDRITANQLANDLARTLAEIDRYTADNSGWPHTGPSTNNQ